jgi:hypothetical protein
MEKVKNIHKFDGTPLSKTFTVRNLRKSVPSATLTSLVNLCSYTGLCKQFENSFKIGAMNNVLKNTSKNQSNNAMKPRITAVEFKFITRSDE